MNIDHTTLGLFPLKAVLFPAARLPLHIFEERYKRLVTTCLDSGVDFGVNLMDSQKVHDVGCSAHVVNVVTRYNDGRMDIVIEGVRRYRLGELDTQTYPYLVSDVAWFDDAGERVDDALLGRAAALYNEIVESVYGGQVESVDPSDLGEGASFKMAQKAGLELLQRQELLTLNTENERLAYLETYFAELAPRVREAERIQGLIRNDGYL